MATLAQISKTPQVWGKLKDNVQVSVRPENGLWDIESNFVTIEKGDPVRRMFRTYTRWDPEATGYYDENRNYHAPKVKPENTLLYFMTYIDGKKVECYTRPENVDVIMLKAAPKEFRTKATKGSTWRFTKDWTFAGYDGTLVEHTIPAGTEFTIKNNKTPMVYFGYTPYGSPEVGLHWNEKGLEIEHNEFLAQFFKLSPYQNVQYLPMKEVSAYVELVSEGQRKVYWVIENSNGERIVDKRFKNLGNVKSSLRVRGGLVRIDETGSYDDQPDYWFEGDNEWGDNQFSNGVWAVQYDHGTDKEISREDMLEYMTIAKLSS